ncbi:hypothetical protein YC2023_071033 [Brassica napus]
MTKSSRVGVSEIYIFYSYIIGNEPYWAYVLADEAVSAKSSSLKFLNNNTKSKLNP